MIDKFIVKIAKSAMPSSCKYCYNYYRIAVIETDGVKMPKQIHKNHKSVLSIRYLKNRLYRGKTEKSAFYIRLNEAKKIADELNKNFLNKD